MIPIGQIPVDAGDIAYLSRQVVNKRAAQTGIRAGKSRMGMQIICLFLRHQALDEEVVFAAIIRQRYGLNVLLLADLQGQNAVAANPINRSRNGRLRSTR